VEISGLGLPHVAHILVYTFYSVVTANFGGEKTGLLFGWEIMDCERIK